MTGWLDASSGHCGPKAAYGDFKIEVLVRGCSATQGRVFANGERGDTPGSFWQPRFPKTLNQQLRV
jgi:hypothetical protein